MIYLNLSTRSLSNCSAVMDNSLSLLGILNSKLVWFFLKSLCSVLGDADKGGRLLQQKIYIEEIPIPKPKKIHEEMVKLVQTMLEAHKRKQKIIKEYSGWLEHLVGAEIEALQNKTNIRDLKKLADVNQLADLLKKNRKRINFNTADPDNYHNLSKGFEKFKGELDPLVKEINQTDRDIDRLVYKLYALTPEEIEIVEGRENPCED